MKVSARSKACWVLAVWVLAAMGAEPAWAGTIFVSTGGNDESDGTSWITAKQTVQAGLNAAEAGDEVWVAAGTYVEIITLMPEVALYGGFAGGETDLAQRNWATNRTILDGNQAGSVVTSPSGAPATTRIDGFTIRNGTGTILGSLRLGGGIYCADYSHPRIANNMITGNTAPRGGGIYCYSGQAVITNNTITANGGGGIYCEADAFARIINNTLTGNSGDGISCSYSSPTVVNTIIAFNSSGVFVTSGSPTLRYNCVYENREYNYSGMTDPTGTNGNLSVDPAVAGWQYGNWHLRADSPCVDAGNDGVVSSGWLDLDGQTRIQGLHVDIGADESDGTDPPAGPNVIVRVRPDGNDAEDGSSWTLAKQTVQAGIDAVAPLGGEVWVKAGTYPERIALRPFAHVYGGFVGSEDTREQRDFRSNVTILDGQQGGSVVTTQGSGYAVDAIDGFTITNGKATSGGGVFCHNSSPMIANNTIAGNTVTSGGAIYCDAYSSPTIASNTITSNTATSGGGIYCYDSSQPRIANNAIVGNTATSGGGIYCASSSSPRIMNNAISGNTGGGIDCAASCYPKIVKNVIGGNTGSGIYCRSYCFPTIASNAISGNTGVAISCEGSSSPAIVNNTISGNGGGGIHCDVSSFAKIMNNTITGNSSGGIYCSSPSPTIVNTIIAFNTSGVSVTGSSPRLRYNCVYGNREYNYSPGMTDPTGTNGNLLVDPRLAGWQYGNWHLRVNSPCVGAGDNASLPPDTGDLDGNENAAEPLPVDLDGQPRIQGPDGIVDIGADESDGSDPPEGPNVIVRVGPDGNDAKDGSSWTLAKQTVQAGIDAAAARGGEVWVQAGTYPERITLRLFAHVYGGFNGTETSTDERDFRSNVTILDGQQGGSVVTVQGGGYRVNTIDGFTITNGKASAGGIYCSSSSPTISNNTITANSGYSGGGISCGLHSSPLIMNNTISGNIAPSGSASHGGGIYCFGSSPAIANNTIAGNIAQLGGGIYCEYNAQPTIVSNAITDNTASGAGGYGGGIYCYDRCRPTIASNTISGNTASGLHARGGGIYFRDCIMTIVNNTITGNMASGSVTSHGGAIYCQAGGTVVTYAMIANTIVAFNSSGIYQSMGSSTTLDLRYDCVYGNMAYNYDGGVADPTGTNGNISEDPLFMSTNDLRLLPGSPCIDAGNDADVPADTLDLDGDGNITEPIPFDLSGHARFIDDPATPDCRWAPGTCGTAPIVDMGAYEFILEASPDIDGDGDIDADDFDLFLAAFGHRSGQQGYNVLADLDGDGAVTFVDYQQWLQAYREANSSPQAPAPLQVLGDFGLDGHVDATDLEHLEACTTGPGVPQTDEACRDADLDKDGDVDQADFGSLQRCLSGPDEMVDLGCKY